MKAKSGCVLFFILAFSNAWAQMPVQVRGRFNADSISVGQVIQYSLSASYPQNLQVLFPDSTYEFKPFEYSGRRFVTTRTTNGKSYDSAVYLLTTFETDSIQTLSLPVFVIQEKDCVVFKASTDSLRLVFHVPAAIDTVSLDKLPLKSNTLYQRVSWILNYPLVALAILILLLTLLTLWIIFGKRIRKHFALKKLQKGYREFIDLFNASVDRLNQGFNSRQAEEALLLWKRYMESLEKYPYTKSTSREILKQASDPELGKALRTIDRGIYGGISAPVDAFKNLASYSQQRFSKREEEVKHG